MRKGALCASIALGALVASWAVLAHGEKEPEQIGLSGEVIDIACYLAHEARGADHEACAKRCVKGGQPMGLLDGDGTVWVLYAHHVEGTAFALTKELAGRDVDLRGVPSERGGMKGLEVRQVAARPPAGR